MKNRTLPLVLLLLAAIAGPSSASFVMEITPSHPTNVGSIGTVGGEVVATNLGLASITDGSTTIALGQYLDFQTGPWANFFVLTGLVQVFGGTPPTAYGLGGQYDLTTTGAVHHLTMSGMDAALSPALADAFGVYRSARYDGTLSVDYVTNPGLAGGQVLGGTITLEARAAVAGVPEPSSLILTAVGLATILAIARCSHLGMAAVRTWADEDDPHLVVGGPLDGSVVQYLGPDKCGRGFHFTFPGGHAGLSAPRSPEGTARRITAAHANAVEATRAAHFEAVEAAKGQG